MPRFCSDACLAVDIEHQSYGVIRPPAAQQCSQWPLPDQRTCLCRSHTPHVRPSPGTRITWRRARPATRLLSCRQRPSSCKRQSGISRARGRRLTVGASRSARGSSVRNHLNRGTRAPTWPFSNGAFRRQQLYQDQSARRDSSYQKGNFKPLRGIQDGLRQIGAEPESDREATKQCPERKP